MSEQAQGDPSAQGTAAGAALADKIRAVGDTVSREIGQVREEVSERAAGGAKGAAMLSGAGAAGAVTVIAAASVPLLMLRRIMPPWGIALLIAAGAGGLAAVLGRRGLEELGAAVPMDVDGLKDTAREAMKSMS